MYMHKSKCLPHLFLLFWDGIYLFPARQFYCCAASTRLLLSAVPKFNYLQWFWHSQFENVYSEINYQLNSFDLGLAMCRQTRLQSLLWRLQPVAKPFFLLSLITCIVKTCWFAKQSILTSIYFSSNEAIRFLEFWLDKLLPKIRLVVYCCSFAKMT